MYHRSDDQDRKEYQEQRINDLSYPHCDLARLKREVEHEREEYECEYELPYPEMFFAHKRRNARCERDGSAPWDREERSYREIEYQGEPPSVCLPGLACELEQVG